jgi:SAM-dependent methyltransferase
VFAITEDASIAAAVRSRVEAATVIRAGWDRMPFRPRWFDAVTVAVDAPRLTEAFPETFRVLRPGGHLGLLRATRDDTVPWVRRLTALIRAHDPTAMTSAATGPTEAEILDGGWFVATEIRSFRLWVPIDRPTLLAMVERRGPVQELDATDRRNLLADVGMLFDDIARGHEIKLPYRIECRKAWPDPDLQAAEPSVTVGIHLHW